MANDFLKFLAIVGTIIIVGLIIVIIGIQHEHLTKLRDRKAELEIMLQDRDKKIEELERELMRYDKKRKKAEKDRKE